MSFAPISTLSTTLIFRPVQDFMIAVSASHLPLIDPRQSPQPIAQFAVAKVCLQTL